MKRREWEELKNSTYEELLAKLNDFQKELFNLRMKHQLASIKNPLKIRMLRRNVARVKTLLREKFNKKL